jgi:hypothetical protein
VRCKVTSRTKTAVRDKLRELSSELEAGVHASARYTVAECIEDWLAHGLTSRPSTTVDNYRRIADHVISALGTVRLKNLTARQVQAALDELAPSLSTRSLRLLRQVLERAIRHAQTNNGVAYQRRRLRRRR